MSDSTNISVFGQETYFNEKINAFSGIESDNLTVKGQTTSDNLNVSNKTETKEINITEKINGISITASNAYGTRYVSVGSTPDSNSTGSNGDVWYTI
jgi:hypothetical protein